MNNNSDIGASVCFTCHIFCHKTAFVQPNDYMLKTSRSNKQRILHKWCWRGWSVYIDVFCRNIQLSNFFKAEMTISILFLIWAYICPVSVSAWPRKSKNFPPCRKATLHLIWRLSYCAHRGSTGCSERVWVPLLTHLLNCVYLFFYSLLRVSLVSLAVNKWPQKWLFVQNIQIFLSFVCYSLPHNIPADFPIFDHVHRGVWCHLLDLYT